MFKHTKIGATIGPSCESVNVLEQMVKAGMNFARLNFAHGTYDSHMVLIKNIRAVEKKTGEPIAILQDLQGPRIRVGVLPDVGVTVKKGEAIVFNTKLSKYNGKQIPVDHHELHKFIKKGHRILIDDGRIECEVIKVAGTVVTAEVIQEGVVKSHKGINLPDSKLKIPAISEKDKSDLRFGVMAGVDMVGLSFVSSAKDVKDVRKLIEKFSKQEKIDLQPIAIIAKIERIEAVKNIKSIVAEADGVMVARGDLGLELPTGEVPIIQKRIIEECNRQAKPVIVATQLLNSMQTSTRPTRAEASDVANAVIDHADALLLTNETASGDYPVLAVATMSSIVLSTESSVYDDLALPPLYKKGWPIDEAIVDMVKLLTDEVKAHVILGATKTGLSARLLSHVRPALPILIATERAIIWRQINISWGVKPILMKELPVSSERFLKLAEDYLHTTKQIKKGQKLVVVLGEPVGEAGRVNMVELVTV